MMLMGGKILGGFAPHPDIYTASSGTQGIQTMVHM
jgi:hypothetical protein